MRPAITEADADAHTAVSAGAEIDSPASFTVAVIEDVHWAESPGGCSSPNGPSGSSPAGRPRPGRG